MSDQGPWVTKTILELEERVAELTEEIGHLEDSLIKQGQRVLRYSGWTGSDGEGLRVAPILPQGE